MADLWQPRTFLRFEKKLETSTGVALVVTDAGRAYLKPLGNQEGPHVLACEWVGTQLARWFGVLTPDCATMQIEPSDEIELGHGRRALPGPAFVSRALPGHPWSGSEKELARIENPQVISWLVVFDTWVRNVDRFPPPGTERSPNYDNLLLTREGASKGRFRLVAIDHTHCFTGGRELTGRLAHIDNVQDPEIYGLFPAFKPFLRQEELERAVHRLREVKKAEIEAIIEGVPPAWEVSPEARAALGEFLLRRAAFLADTLLGRLDPQRWPGSLFDQGRP